MALDRVALDGSFVRLEPLEERHREPSGRRRSIPRSSRSRLGAGPTLRSLYRQCVEAQRRAGMSLPSSCWLKAEDRSVGMTRYLNIEEAHTQARDRLDLVRAVGMGGRGQSGMQAAADAACLRDAEIQSRRVQDRRAQCPQPRRHPEARRHAGRHPPQAHDHGRRPCARFGLLLVDRRATGPR